MRRIRASVVVVTAMAVTLGGVMTASTAATKTDTGFDARATAQATDVIDDEPAETRRRADKGKKKKKKFRPRPGVITNNPLGPPAAKQRINNRIIKTIDATGRKQSIRVHSWNIRNQRIVDALVRAHRRGVSVKVIIWIGNARPDNPNPLFAGMTTALKKGNKKRPKARKSGTKRCKGSCRGSKGLPHSKYFLFTKANGVKHIVMYGGHNATDLAATHQWNDVDVFTENEAIFNDFWKIFDQSFRDRARKNPWVTRTHGRFETQFYPYQGKGAKGDPIVNDIKQIQCTGAARRLRKNGRTQIRIAMTSWHGPRGIEIAKALVAKQNQGCDLKIVYAVAGNEVLRVLRQDGRKRVPLRQITQDFNGDGVYDRYLHTKVMVVRGVWNGDNNASMVWNGSANWSPLVIKSDEAGMRMNARGRARDYAKYVDWLFANPPPQHRMAARAAAAAVGRGVDPYANIEVD